jgi:ribosome-associated protein
MGVAGLRAHCVERYLNKGWRQQLEPLELARVIIDKLEEHQAADIVLLDTRKLTPLMDFFVIATVESDRQGKMLEEIVREELKKEHSIRPLSTEGEPASGWTLMDYNSVIVHLFSQAGRERYRLQELWGEAPVLLKIQ